MTSSRFSLDRYRVSTEPLRTQRRIELVVLVLLLVLCFQLLYSGARFAAVSMPEAVAPAADALVVKAVGSTGDVSRAQSAEIQGRPLFWEGRRPLEAPTVVVEQREPTKKAGKLKGIKLLGIFGAGESAGIIVSEQGKMRRILQGEELAGWTVDAVNPDSVVFKSGDRSETLLLRQGMVSNTPAASAAPAKVNGGARPSPKRSASPAGEGGGLSLGGRPSS